MCEHPSSGYLTRFSFIISPELGQADDVDSVELGKAGNGVDNCERYKLPEGESISSIDVHAAGVVFGITVSVGDKTRSFGLTNLAQGYKYRFTDTEPVIGLYGY